MILGNDYGTHHHNTANWTLNAPRDANYMNTLSMVTRDGLVDQTQGPDLGAASPQAGNILVLRLLPLDF